MVYCRICGGKSEKRLCNNCEYLLKNDVDEETIKRMLSDDVTKKIWKANEKRAEELGDAYYDSVVENYKVIKCDSKENFGYNTFVDGIRISLDIIIPLLDDKSQQVVIEKINSMINIRKSAQK